MCRKQKFPRLRNVEYGTFEEDIAKIRKPLFRNDRQHTFNYKINVPVGIACIFVRNCMCTEECGSNILCAGSAETANDAELLQLIFRIQSVTAFNFNRCNAEIEHFRKKASSAFKKLILGCFARVGQRVQNAAACIENIKVACACNFQRHFMRAPATENKMGVCVNKSGCCKRTVSIDDIGICRIFRKLSVCSHRSDFFTVNENCRIVQHFDFALIRTAAAACAERGCKCSDVFNKKHRHLTFSRNAERQMLCIPFSL